MKYLLQAEQVIIAKLQSIFCVDSFRDWTIEADFGTVLKQIIFVGFLGKMCMSTTAYIRYVRSGRDILTTKSPKRRSLWQFHSGKEEDGCLTKRVVCRQLSIFRENIIALWLSVINFIGIRFGRDAVYKLLCRQRGTQTRKYLHVPCRYFRKSCNPYIPNGREIKCASDKRNYKKLCPGDISSTMFPRSADVPERQLFENRTRDSSKHSACCHPERGLLHKTFSEEKGS